MRIASSRTQTVLLPRRTFIGGGDKGGLLFGLGDKIRRVFGWDAKPEPVKSSVLDHVEETKPKIAEKQKKKKSLVRPRITYEVGKLGRLASGSVMARCGDSVVFSTAVSADSADQMRDFMPLSVEYREKFYSTGSIPKTHTRREMAPTDEEILGSRVIDRVVRPLFPPGYLNETQLTSTVHAFDQVNDPLVLAINSASAALALSDIPWYGPVACVRIARVDNEFIVNPTMADKERSCLDLLFAAKSNQVLMIEASGNEILEDVMAEAMELARNEALIIRSDIIALAKAHGREKRQHESEKIPDEIREFTKKIGRQRTTELFSSKRQHKADRVAGERELQQFVRGELAKEFPGASEIVRERALHDMLESCIRDVMLQSRRFGQRFDGRDQHEVRPLEIETEVLPVVHGSALFGRGDTQTLCTVTLGSLDAAQRLNSATGGEKLKHAILNYDFPPYCVNETGRLGVNRRMIGHGALAEKALRPALPPIDEFPYMIRMTSETTMSDGSSSMATTCGVYMALLDAGVPLTTKIAGVSIGLVSQRIRGRMKGYALLTDILGTEDHFGDMDFKVAGSETGITAIQLDVKAPVPLGILIEALEHAKTGRLDIIKQISDVVDKPREERDHLPSSRNVQVPQSAVSTLIGPGGSTIRGMETETNCKITLKGDVVSIFGKTEAEVQNAVDLIQGKTFALKRGETYSFQVTEILDFGAYLAGPQGVRAFVHISKLGQGRIERVKDVLKLGDTFEGIVIDDRKTPTVSVKDSIRSSSESDLLGQTLSATITAMTPYGMRVETATGVKYTIPSAEIDQTQKYNVGDAVEGLHYNFRRLTLTKKFYKEITIAEDNVGRIIGKGGRNVSRLVSKYNCLITNESGRFGISAISNEDLQLVIQDIEEMCARQAVE